VKNLPKIFIIISVLSVIGVVIYLVIGNFEFFTSKLKTQENTQSTGQVIALIGEENIYQSDLDTEIKYFPTNITEVEGVSTKQYLLNKIIEDSILLQESGQVLSNNIYNSPTKDYLERTKQTQELKDLRVSAIENLKVGISGDLITVWYLNMIQSPYGEAEAKIMAFSKITEIHNKIQEGELSIEQAAQVLKGDNSWSKIDPSYIGNTRYEFKLTEDPFTYAYIKPVEFLEDIRETREGEVTEIYEIELNSNEKYFIFAHIDKIIKESGIVSYSNWVEQVKNKYSIKIYDY
jgi:hypothetical protein